MIFPSNRVRVLVATQPVDFRKGHDGLCALVASTLRKDPYTALPQSVWRTILRTGRFRRDSDDFKEALVARERCFRSKR